MKIVVNYLQDAALTLGVCIPLYILFRYIYIKVRKPQISWKREIVFGIFVLYLLWLASETLLPEFNLSHNAGSLGGTFFYENVHRSAAERVRNFAGINFIPFVTIDRFKNFNNIGQSTVNLIGNIIMFVPMGYLIPLLWKKTRSFWKMFLIGLVASCFIEFTQLFIDRRVDVDDVILNVLGVVLGFFIALVCFKVFPNQKNKYMVGTDEKI